MIYGYPNRPTVIAGGSLRLHYSGDRPKFAVDLYRQGQNSAPDWVMRFPDAGWLDGQLSPFQTGDHDQGWPFIDIPIAIDAPPGVYIANFTEADDGNGGNATAPDATTPDGRSAKALFVVRNAGASRPILLKLALFTYHAYNSTNGGSLYDTLANGKSFLHRPGGGTGGDVFDYINDPDPTSPRQTFAHWEAPFISWLEANGYRDRVDYCTDLDVEEDGAILSGHQLLVCVGHDEYWTANMRAAIGQFRDGGGNIAIFSGNTSYRPIQYYPAELAIERVGAPNDTRWDWRSLSPPEPENPLTGVSYARAGGWWFPNRPQVGYAVKAPTHWVFAGLKLERDQVIGQEDYLVGYECDGCLFGDDGNGNLMATGEDQSPTSFQVLGVGPVNGWSRDQPGIGQDQVATMGLYVAASGAFVFNAATTDWGRALFKGGPASRTILGTITHNLLTRMSQQTGVAPLATFDRIVAVDGFFSPDDDYRHAVVATADGSLTEIFFNPQRGQGQALLDGAGALPGNVIDVGAFYSDDDRFRHVIAALDDGQVWELFYNPASGQGQTALATLTGVVAVSGFFSPDDDYRHAIVATADGNVTEIFYNPQFGQGQVVLANFAGVLDVASFFSADDGYRHAIVATSDGNVTEIFYNPQLGQGQVVLANFAGLLDVASFFSPDDGYRHAIVATSDGNVTEIFYSPQLGQGQVVLANIPGATRVGAFFAPDDPLFSRRVVVACSDGTIRQIKYGPAGGIVTTQIASIGGVIDLGGFFSSDDGYRHAIVAASDGSVQELFYQP